MTKQFELADTDLDVVTGGADAEPQDAYIYDASGTGPVIGGSSQNNATKIPGMHKFANVTLKRGRV